MARFKQEVYDALDKDASERTFWEKIQSAYAEPFIEADKDKDKSPSDLPENYKDFVEELSIDVKADIERYLNIFKNDIRPVLKHIDEIKDKGHSDYIPKGKFLKEFDDINKFDKKRWQDVNFLGKGFFDATYRDDKSGDEARQKIVDHPLGQIAVGPGH